MHIYTSGTPDNDDFQVIENQLCSHRLFSMHGQYAPQVLRWLDLLRRGIRTFEDYEKDQVALGRRFAVEDRKACQKLAIVYLTKQIDVEAPAQAWCLHEASRVDCVREGHH